MGDTRKKLHAIGNAHIDPVWLWRWQEGLQEVKATFRSALDRLAETKELFFTASSAAFYEWVEENDPRMFAEIRERVREGRWEVVGGWWIEPDCNLPSGESLARQALYAQRFFRERFGRAARVGFAPDSFGHAATLPQLLAKSGLSSYVFMRPEPGELPLPARTFVWESADGSRVLAFRIPFTYCTAKDDLEHHVRRCAAELAPPFEEQMCFFGVGNHGGGPTKRNIASLEALAKAPDLPAIAFSTCEAFFETAAANARALPVVKGELQHHSRGCYASHSEIKAQNRAAEHELLRAEKACALAARVAGARHPSDFTRAWKNVLFCQFHDVLAGTSLEHAYDDARHMLGEARSIAARNLNAAVQSIAWSVDLPHEEDAKPVFVLNPHAWTVRAPIALEIGGLKDEHVLVDDEGREVPFQLVRSQALAGPWRKRVAFVADLPPLGWRVYRFVLRPGPPAATTTAVSTATATARAASDGGSEVPRGIANDALRLEIDPATGFVTSLFDVRLGRELLAAPARAVVHEDRTDTWGHGLVRMDDEAGAFRLVSAVVTAAGRVVQSLRVESAFGDSRLTQEYVLHAGVPRLDVNVHVDWRERRRALKLAFPLAVPDPRLTVEVPYGAIERPLDGTEESMHAWVDVSSAKANGGFGVGVLNDAKYMYSAEPIAGGALVALTVVRSPIYAHHDPQQPEPGATYAFLDQGRQSFTYALVPHAGDFREGACVRHAWELQEPPIALLESTHPGKLPRAMSWAEVEPRGVVLSVVKRAEDAGDGGDDALVVRLYEAHGVATRARLRLPAVGRTIEADFAPGEIKTFRVPVDAARPVVEVNLIEDAVTGR